MAGYIALRECRYDRNYNPGDKIDASVIDASILHNAIAYGYIMEDESPETPSASANEKPEPRAAKPGRSKKTG